MKKKQKKNDMPNYIIVYVCSTVDICREISVLENSMLSMYVHSIMYMYNLLAHKTL